MEDKGAHPLKRTRSNQLDSQLSHPLKEMTRRLLLRGSLILTIIPVLLVAHLIHPIACDGISGGLAPRRLDLCSTCRGDNSTCRVVSGIFTRPQLTVGYNLVALIPRGACNLNITEIRKSPNHLALRRKDASFVFNGDWRLSWTGEYEAAGTTFQYTRQDLKTLESITSLGPIQEPLDLMVLYQQPNPGIKYEYMFPFSDSPLPPVPLAQDSLLPNRGGHHHLRQPAAATSRPSSYVNIPPGNANPSASSTQILQPQQQQPAIPPYNAISSFPVNPIGPPGGSSILYPGDPSSSSHHHLHNHHGRRRNHPAEHHRSSNKQPVSPVVGVSAEKKFYWKITGYTNCTEPCGGGMQRSIIRCVRGSAGNPVSDRRCSSEEKPPGQTIRCNLKPCPAEWDIGDWSSCSADCGEGSKTRGIHCQQRISPTLTMRVAEGACLQQKPETRTICTLRPCNHWQTSEWSQCSSRCGNGVRKRSVTCVGSAGHRLSLEECDQAEKPAELTPCNMGPCEGVDWFVSEWSTDCSQKCGGGIQTRHVVCSGLQNPFQSQNQFFYQHGNGSDYYGKLSRKSSSSELETNLIEEDDNLRHHGSHAGDDDGESQLHASGSLFQHQQSHQQFFCDESRKPAEERECFSDRSCGEPVWFTGDWGECSVSCGNGIRTRQVVCVLFTRGKFKVASDSLCSVETKPAEREACESRTCPARWFTTDWNECSALCGGGVEKRSVSCRASNWTLSSSLCSDKDRPMERRSCNEHKCTLQPASAGGGNELGGMVKDKPVLLQSAHGELSHEGALRYHPVSTNSSGNFGPRVSPVLQPSNSPGLVHSSRGRHHSLHNEPNEEAEETECTDQYRNCALVVQARLCRYKYYRSVCCNSCSDAIV